MAALTSAQHEIRALASEKNAELLRRFFKTGPGQYGEGDFFLGVKVPPLRRIARRYAELNPEKLKLLLHSRWHEERYVAGQILILQYQKAESLAAKKKVLLFYLQQRKAFNNWDLVDSTAYHIAGDFAVLSEDKSFLLKLSDSPDHWDKRMAVVGTLALIRSGDNTLIYRLARKYLNEKEDLMHKAVGWMLREAGKRDSTELREFIKKYGPRMPRTMLRYAIERFPAGERKKILTSSKR